MRTSFNPDGTASSRVLDTLLEKYLIERLDRIEKFLKLPPYVPHDTEQAA